MTSPVPAGVVSAQGNYAGAVSRLIAFLVDLAISVGIFALGLNITNLVAQIVTGHNLHWNRSDIVVVIVFALWEFFYFGYSWAASGRSAGMAVLGVRVVGEDGASLEPWRGFLRALVFLLSFLFCGLGFLGILVDRRHRALHDLIAKSAVVYAWDARAARLRFLARAGETGGQPAAESNPAPGAIRGG
jgi:uncharacterized RDD family membrane protein YckC